MRLPLPDESYRLNAAERASIGPNIDANALERLLQHLSADDRPHWLSQYVLRPPAEHTADKPSAGMPEGAARIPDVRILVRVSDPVLQDLLEQVWQPYWDQYSDHDLALSDETIPGLELARRRRGNPVRD